MIIKSSDKFQSDLRKMLLNAISSGSQRILIWGFNPECVDLLSWMYSQGLLRHLAAIVSTNENLAGQSHFNEIPIIQPECIHRMSFDTLLVTSDEDKEEVLSAFAGLDDRLPTVIIAGNRNYQFKDSAFTNILKSCPVKPKAGGYPNMLIHLYQSLRYIAEQRLQGIVAEFGVYQGGTTVFMAKVLEHLGHHLPIYGFDTFSGFPQPSSILDMYSDSKCEFSDFPAVERYCAPYGIQLVRGDIRVTSSILNDLSLALSFFDTDNYSACLAALTVCWNRTIQGGILAFDHYFSPDWITTIGERIAVLQFMREKRVFNLHGTGIFIKL